MKQADVQLGKTYLVKVAGRIAPVKLVSVSPYGGWIGESLLTGREVRIRTAAKLRREYQTAAPVVKSECLNYIKTALLHRAEDRKLFGEWRCQCSPCQMARAEIQTNKEKTHE